VPRSNLFKIGVATAAAAVGAILAITSVFAHTTPTMNGHSLVGSIVTAATLASLPAKEPVPSLRVAEQALDDQEAAELAAKIAAQQAALAAQQAAKQAALAAKQAEEAAEAAPSACQIADQGEDTLEKAADKTEDAKETNGTVTESPIEDANEKTLRQAADKLESPEVKCVVAPAATHTDSDKHPATSTFTVKAKH
jgi:hypothetical protein